MAKVYQRTLPLWRFMLPYAIIRASRERLSIFCRISLLHAYFYQYQQPTGANQSYQSFVSILFIYSSQPSYLVYFRAMR